MHFIWKNLPVFFICFIGASVLNNALHHISPPMTDVVSVSFFPLGIALILLWYALKNEDRWFSLKAYFAWVLVMTVIYCLPMTHGLLVPFEKDTQRIIYELSALVEFIVLVLHGRTWLDRWGWIRIFGVTLVYGMILENGGIIMGVFSEPGYLFGVPFLRAPLATAIGWVNVMYCAFFASERLLPGMHTVFKGGVCAIIGLSLDIPFDPVATKLGWWVWNASLDRFFIGVPVINFVAWFWAIFPYAAVYYWIKDRKDAGEARKVMWLVGAIPGILLLELAGVMITLMVLGDKAGLMIFKEFIGL